MKRPSFQFYPSDWLRDAALRSCSIGARGLWMDMICYMHEGTPYGYLKVNNKVILAANLARMCGLTLDEAEGYLVELSDAGVCQKDDDGAIFSKRMIRDENLRNIRASGGKLGGNPALKDNQLDDLRLTSKVKQKPTPSSSSASSSSNNKEQRGSRLASDWVLLKTWGDWATAERPDLDIRRTADDFRDYWHSVAGAKGVKLDWLATWRVWVRGQKAQRPQIADIARQTVPSSGEYEESRARVAKTFEDARPPTKEEREALTAAINRMKVKS